MAAEAALSNHGWNSGKPRDDSCRRLAVMGQAAMVLEKLAARGDRDTKLSDMNVRNALEVH
jgi:hypothetical protein